MSLIRDADLIADGNIPVELINNCITAHSAMTTRYKKLSDYYLGYHAILTRVLQNTSLPNNKLVCNHAEYISDMATGYFLGNPIVYKSDKQDISVITDNLRDIDAHSHDTEIARNISIYGVGYELAFSTSDLTPIVDLAELDPTNAFLVVDDTVKHNPLFGVHYYPRFNLNGSLNYYTITIYAEDRIIKYRSKDLTVANYELVSKEPHYFGMVPLIEYKNKKSMQGDFEQVISLIDAYNLLQSDRLNDKEQLVDALLVVSGASFGDDEAEVTKTAKTIKELKILELPDGADAKWLIKSLSETEVEVLKTSIKDDIHEFSKVPNLTDENFGNAASGVSLAYKLLAFEQLTKTKENFFRAGIKQRLRLMANFYDKKGYTLDMGQIDIEMTRSLPVNQVEIVNMVVALDGVVTDETRIGLLTFIDDPVTELKNLKVEQAEKVKVQQQEFGSFDFKQGTEVDEGTE